MRLFLLSLWVTASIYAQSFYVLTGIKKYDPLVSSIPELEIYNEDIKASMMDMSKELKIDISGHPSRVLACIISKFSVGDTVALKVDLELAEYMKREGETESVFAISYADTQMFKLDDDIEEELIDTIEEMLAKFAHQYKDDNKNISEAKAGITHANFASHMAYETDYTVALSKAKKEGKPLFVFMSTSYCPWCRKLEKRVLSKTKIDKKIKDKYVPLMLNFNKKKFPKQLNDIALTPTLYIINPKTQKIEHQFVGYSSRDEFLDLLK